MNKLFSKKAQGALEYLLVLSTVVIVSAIVIVSLVSTSEVALSSKQNTDSMLNPLNEKLLNVKPIYLRIIFVEGENSLKLSDIDGASEFDDEILLEDLFKGAPIGTKVEVGEQIYEKIIEEESISTIGINENKILFQASSWDPNASEVMINKNIEYTVIAPFDFSLQIDKINKVSQRVIIDDSSIRFDFGPCDCESCAECNLLLNSDCETVSLVKNIVFDKVENPAHCISFADKKVNNFDCKNYSITNEVEGRIKTGVSIDLKPNVNISNCTIKDFFDGIRISGGSRNNNIFNNEILNSTNAGIWVGSDTSNNLINNNILLTQTKQAFIF